MVENTNPEGGNISHDLKVSTAFVIMLKTFFRKCNFRQNSWCGYFRKYLHKQMRWSLLWGNLPDYPKSPHPCFLLVFKMKLIFCKPGQNIWNKEKKSSKTGQDQKTFDTYFCILFDCYCQSLISRGETGRWAISPSKFEIFLLFPNFLSAQVLSHSQTREACYIPSLLY